MSACFVFLVEVRFQYVGQAGFKLLTSSDPPALASHSAGIKGVRHYAQLVSFFLAGISPNKSLAFLILSGHLLLRGARLHKMQSFSWASAF